MKEKIVLFISTRKNKEEILPFLKNVNATINCHYQVIICNNPGTHSLTNLYSSFLDKESDENKSTLIYLFCHDDIEFVTINWGRKLIELFNNNPEYGIIGLAGSKFYDGTRAWWGYDTKYKVGKIIHRIEGKGMWMTAMSKHDTNGVEEVAVIDGVFIAVDATKISQNFDKNVKGFHFYDIDFCLNNFKDKSCKIGVTTDFRIIHQSAGNLSPAWKVNQELVNEKYKDIYPVQVGECEDNTKNNSD